MAKVKTFSSQLEILHEHEELEVLDKAVNDSATDSKGQTMGLIRVVAYE
jgi:hypothetical protein